MSEYITNKVLAALGAAGLGLAAADFFVDRHGSFPIEHMLLFYCLFGFVVYAGLIFLAKGLRRLILRPEDYYGAEATDREDERAAGTEEADRA